MKNTLKIQKDGVNTLKEEILANSNARLKKIYVIASNIKETGYDIIEECLIDLKARKFIAFGIDKKNTTRKILDNVLNYTKNVYIWNNNDVVEFNANILVFEYEAEAIVYIFQGSITDSVLETDLSLYTKVEYDLIKDKKEYEEYIDVLTKEIKDNFKKLDKEYISELVEQKQIFSTKQYTHIVPSISELLGNTKQEEEKEIVEEVKPLPKIELDKIEFDAFEIDLGDISVDDHSESEEETKTIIDIEENEETIISENVEEQSEIENNTSLQEDNEEYNDIEDENYDFEISDEVIDMESMVLESEVIRLDKSTIAKKRAPKKAVVEDKQASKKINLSKVSNIIMELGLKPSKGKDINKIKIPNYIKDMIPNFFEIMEDAKYIKNESGEYKEANIKLEVIDVNTSNKYVDNNACIRQKSGQTYIEFESSTLENVMYEEMDIARVIKLAKDSYHIEIIPNGIEEYALWNKMCTNNFKGSNRQYGLM